MSKFAGLFDEPKAARKRAPVKREQRAAPAAVQRRGRPAGHAGGKRSDPDYTAITAYVRRDDLNKAKAKLLLEQRDLSDLVQEAIEKFLRSDI